MHCASLGFSGPGQRAQGAGRREESGKEGERVLRHQGHLYQPNVLIGEDVQMLVLSPLRTASPLPLPVTGLASCNSLLWASPPADLPTPCLQLSIPFRHSLLGPPWASQGISGMRTPFQMTQVFPFLGPRPGPHCHWEDCSHQHVLLPLFSSWQLLAASLFKLSRHELFSSH